MNPISPEIKTGTIGELLVQLRLLQYGVQSAQPLKDSGNDLIAVKGNILKAIQVKTRKGDRFSFNGLDRKEYHILALVRLESEENDICLDRTKIYLLRKDEVTSGSCNVRTLDNKELKNRVTELFLE